ncbi:Mitochondrial inner membrane translocase subunit Tim17/Tim22/Tim23/peroxisomal protein PMP24 [Gossypium australe]|uniref:Mitochondrial inner membrane translocase subunit Tim17/Tim22/Tim23/peroxisomal protein PMP24 n=1 Tax=Gossypium australe TaxID=47621 RepID=A0A5B6W3J0_9ROSI|nr:Mitochondrial inner membrane translocase subunit Tim17/Tim22/Tim23/peroxisomal protein PMP24 [Gossypium australe]
MAFKLHMICFSALRDVKIPPGPRLLILDHIQSIKREARAPWLNFYYRASSEQRGYFGTMTKFNYNNNDSFAALR